MIQNCSKLRVYDNSGANVVKCFKTFKFKNNAKLNKIIKISVQELKIHKKTTIKKGQVFNALIIKSKYTKPRFNGQRLSFDNNGCILINNINFKNKKTRTKLTLTGSTVFGLTLKEFRLYSIKININAINIL